MEGQVATAEMSEITIKVPWGHISGKVWGSLDAPPILCVHGIQDNASTFDSLIPLLPSSFCYVAIDLPGHGRSSHFPSGFMFTLVDYCMSVNRIVNHFNWKRFIFMGHSLGGQVGYLYASFFPEQVTKLIVFDCVIPYRSVDLAEYIPQFFDKFNEIELKLSSKSPPSYTEEEALRRLTDGRPTPLTREAAQVLFSRGVIRSGEGYAFSADQRLKLRLLQFFSKEEVLSIVSKLQCPVLMIRASESKNAGSKHLFGDFHNLFKTSLGNKYQYIVVEGSHDVHLLHPERLSDDVFNFLIKTRASL